MAGYSPKSLIEKLGLKEGFKALALNAPKNYFRLLGPLPENLVFFTQLKSSLDFIHYFSNGPQNYLKDVSHLKKALAFEGIIWISWPKLSSGIQSDLTEKDIREIGL